MRTPAIALISLVQCHQTMNPRYRPWEWDKYERAAFLWPNVLIVGLVITCVIWAWYRHSKGLAVIQDLHDLDGLDSTPSERALLHRQSRDYARRNRIY
jgi:hypothetical protein